MRPPRGPASASWTWAEAPATRVRLRSGDGGRGAGAGVLSVGARGAQRVDSRRSDEHRISVTARSAAEYVAGEADNEPRALAARAVLEPRGEYVRLTERLLAIYEDANEDPSAFRVTSRYVVATARR
jgi:hypothetical protein